MDEPTAEESSPLPPIEESAIEQKPVPEEPTATPKKDIKGAIAVEGKGDKLQLDNVVAGLNGVPQTYTLQQLENAGHISTPRLTYLVGDGDSSLPLDGSTVDIKYSGRALKVDEDALDATYANKAVVSHDGTSTTLNGTAKAYVTGGGSGNVAKYPITVVKKDGDTNAAIFSNEFRIRLTGKK